jgi:hypothetical protein
MIWDIASAMRYRFPFCILDDHWTGVSRQMICIHSSLGFYIDAMIHIPAHIERRAAGTIPCVVIVTGLNDPPHSWHDVIGMYTAQGFVVVTYTCRGSDFSNNVFSSDEISDAHTVYAYTLSQFPWVNPLQIFLMGTSYCGGVVLRSLSMDINAYCGGIVMSPLTHISSLVDQDGGSVPVVAHSGVAHRFLATSLQYRRNPLTRLLGIPTLRAQTLLEMDHKDRCLYDLDQIVVPIYVHLNIQDSVVDNYHTVKLFQSLLRPEETIRSCIRYMHGDHVATESHGASRKYIYKDTIQWCRSILHHASIQTYRTHIHDASVACTQATPLAPDETKRLHTEESRCISIAPANVQYAGRVLGYLSQQLIPLGYFLRFHQHLMWSTIVHAPLHISGFPLITLRIPPSSYETGFCLYLMEYNQFTFGHRLGQKYVLIPSSHEEQHITIRMPMIASRIAVGHKLTLTVSNYQDRTFLYTGQTDATTVVFTSISLPYLFDH